MTLAARSITTVLAIALAAASPAHAQDRPVQLRFSHWVPPTHSMHGAAVAWAESIDKASNGSIKITIFPGQQLGHAFDHSAQYSAQTRGQNRSAPVPTLRH
jgi:TRAP-type C4-dicarboxylate transport system substrate-binding protein